MDPAVAGLDFAKAGIVLANMIESYLAGGAPPSNPEGAVHDTPRLPINICLGKPTSTFVSRRRDRSAATRRAPSASTIWQARHSLSAGARNGSGPSTGISANPVRE